MDPALFFSFFDMPFHPLNSHVSSRIISGKQLMFVEHKVKKGHITEEEVHENEQLTLVLQGSLLFLLGEKSYLIKKGEALLIPSRTPHRCEVLEDSSLIEVFSPPRQEWKLASQSNFIDN